MENSESGSSLPPEVSEQLRALCTQFEAAWKAGKSPGLDDFLGDTTGEARAQLVRDLTEIEVRYRRDSMGLSAKTQATFQQEPEMVTLVEQPTPHSHTDSHSQQSGRGNCPGLATENAAESRIAIAVFPVFLGLVVLAGLNYHAKLPLFWGFRYDSGIRLESAKAVFSWPPVVLRAWLGVFSA